MRALRLPGWLQGHLDDAVASYMGSSESAVDFTVPRGEPGLAGPDSVSWQVFKNPVALFVGGVAAVILELAEPRVRSGVWEHSTFATRPLDRFRRTAFAAMVTVYGPQSVAREMIAGISRRHAKVKGSTPAGRPYRALDPELLRWVQVTASYGFVESYHRFVRPLSQAQRDRAYAEALPGAALYGAKDSPDTEQGVHALLDGMLESLEPSDIIDEFLAIMRDTRILPGPLFRLQPLLIRAAADVVPPQARARVNVGAAYDFGIGERRMLRAAGAAIDRLVVPSAPPALACRRLGLPEDYLYEP